MNVFYSIKRYGDQWDIVTDRYHVVIHNPIVLINNNKIEDKMHDELASQIGLEIIQDFIIRDNEYMDFIFTSGKKIRVSLLDCDYTGPEAVVFYPTNEVESIIII